MRARLDGSATVLAEQRDDDLVRTIDSLMQILVKYRYIPRQLDTAAQFARV